MAGEAGDEYSLRPSGGLKLKGVKDKRIKKMKKEKSEKGKEKSAGQEENDRVAEKYTSFKTEAERRFEEIQRQRVRRRFQNKKTL
jgi:hypothetical protein